MPGFVQMRGAMMAAVGVWQLDIGISGHGHFHVHPLRHQHQGKPVRRCIHQIQHVHVHAHKFRRNRTFTAPQLWVRATPRGIVLLPNKHISRLFTPHIAVTDHEIARIGQGMIKHNASRGIGVMVGMMPAMPFMVVTWSAQRIQLDLERCVRHPVIEIGKILLASAANF